MDTTNAPQIIEHLNRSCSYTPYAVDWIPDSAKLLVCGEEPKTTGIIEVLQLNKGEFKLLDKISLNRGVKCGTFASSPTTPCFSFGQLDGKLKIMDMVKQKVFWEVEAHTAVVNAIDGCGQGWGFGISEIVSAGRDGCVRVWDPRQRSPGLSLQPAEGEEVIADCWSVAFGNSHNKDDRVLACGYDNGDVKLFDMRATQLMWQTNLKNGVCGVEFDRKDILMNKLVASTLQGKITAFDLRTFNSESGYAQVTDAAQKATIWGVKHVPQNRDLFLTQGGNGGINLYKYIYPSNRQLKDPEGRARGVAGRFQLLNSKDVCTQPISDFRWHRDKLGLGAMCALDQTCKIVIVTKLNLY